MALRWARSACPSGQEHAEDAVGWASSPGNDPYAARPVHLRECYHR